MLLWASGPSAEPQKVPFARAAFDRFDRTDFGVVRTDKRRYAPLDEARISFECRSEPSSAFVFKVYDGAGRPYCRKAARTSSGTAEFSVTVGGAPGLQIIRVFKEGANEKDFLSFRMGSFVLAPQTAVSAEGTDLDEFFRWLRESLEGGLDWALYEGKWIAGDKAADNSPMNLAYPRFRLDASVYFEDAEVLKGHLNLIYAHQKPDGSLYDHIYADNHPGWAGQRMIRTMMADLETGLIINVHQVWMATADTAWMRALMEPMLRGWRYATTSPDLWCKELGLIKRPHTPDEWDFQMGDSSCFRNEKSKYVVACCDAVRLPKAAGALAAMLDALGRSSEAASLRQFAGDARHRANALLWDGTKYRHHKHLDPVDHRGFDEDGQLVMSNTWACNDGLASHEQAVAILREYERRLRDTGDRYPWWSLQPGYPEGHFPGYSPGVYANGGLFPWVGGELCRACFHHGLPARGWKMFREFWQQVKSDGGQCVTWYTLDGRAASNTPWTTNYDAWGIAAWGRAAIEGLVGVVPLSPALERCRCVPQWSAAGIRRARACIALPASRSYFAYQWTCDASGLELRFTGSGRTVDLAIPVAGLPGWTKASLNGTPFPAARETKGGLECLSLSAPLDGVATLRVEK
jgi:hypothetical protein